MPDAALTPAALTDQAALLPPPPTVAEPRGAPWRVAIAEARGAHRVTRVVPRSTRRAVRAPAADGQTRAAHTNASASSPARPLVPITRCTGGSLLESELAARAPGLRAPAIRPSRGALTSVPVAPFKPSRIDPLNREPTATPGSTAPFKPFRTDPLNREPTAETGSTTPFKPFRTDLLNREPAAKPGSTVPFKPFSIDPLNREPAAKPATDPFEPSGIDPLNRGPGAFQDPEPPTRTPLP